MILRDIDAEYDKLIDELEEAVDEDDPAERGEKMRVVRIRIEDLLRERMGLPARFQTVGQRHGPHASH